MLIHPLKRGDRRLEFGAGRSPGKAGSVMERQFSSFFRKGCRWQLLGCVRHDEKVSVYKYSYSHDGIKQVSPQGETLFYKSIIEIFVENEMGYLIFSLDSYPSEAPVHINEVRPVDFDGEYWKKGDVFLSLRNQSMVLLYRPSTNKIIWKGTGHFSRQHDVDILDQSRISIFNNNASFRVPGEDSFKMSSHETLQGNN